MDNLMLILGWGSPIGTGIFLLCIAGMIFILTKAQKAKGKKDQVELIAFELSMTINGNTRWWVLPFLFVSPLLTNKIYQHNNCSFD